MLRPTAPPAPPATCEHDGERPAYGVCKCVCRRCWDSSRPIGDRCIDQWCQVHHPPIKVTDKRAITQ